MIRLLLWDIPRHVLLFAIAVYRRAVAPVFAPSCRFVPSCSAYGEEAVRRFGPWRGGWMIAARLLRCHPWGSFGYDPVPESGPAPTSGRG